MVYSIPFFFVVVGQASCATVLRFLFTISMDDVLLHSLLLMTTLIASM